MPSSMEAPPSGPVVYRPLRLLTVLTADLQERRDIAELLELIVARTALLLGTERATLSLLDPTGTRGLRRGQG